MPTPSPTTSWTWLGSSAPPDLGRRGVSRRWDSSPRPFDLRLSAIELRQQFQRTGYGFNLLPS